MRSRESDPLPRKVEPKSLNILIYGSCVSRDAFRLIETEHKITGFVARNPLGSAFRGRASTVALKDVDPKGILEDGFPRRMLELNLSGEVPSFLRERAVTSDLLLVDLIDERLPLIDIKGDAVCYCQALRRTYNPSAEQNISYSSARRKQLTEFGIEELLKFALKYDIPVLLNPAKWSTHPDGGREVQFSEQRNREIDQVISMFYAKNVHMVDYRNHVFMPDIGHRWGAAPYHYTLPTYEILLEGIDEWADLRRRKAT